MIPVEVLPVLDMLPHLRLRKPYIPLPPDLLLRLRKLLLLLTVFVIDGDKHLLNTGQVRGEIILETPRDERAGGVPPGEETVHAPWAVDARVCRDVEDGAVQGEVDGEIWVGAIVQG